MDRRERLAAVFEDTQRFYTENAALAAAVEQSRKNTRLYASDDYPVLPDAAELSRQGEVTVTKSRTFAAAMRLKKEFPDKKIAVLNFASATRPGGGVKNGSSAQEESLCRCSTLYPTIDQKWVWQAYYEVNRAAGDACHTDDCIYSPGVIICKTDTNEPERMEPKDWCEVDVISCAAPNLRKKPANRHNPSEGAQVKLQPKQLYELHLQRAKHIFTVAAANSADVLVLGAFGCGAFANDPVCVAKAYRSAVAEYRNRFDRIEFAIYCRPDETANYDTFQRALKFPSLKS